MSNATIVTLGSANFAAPATAFEQEFSEARGRGRARRQARKLDRANKRSARKTNRQTLRQGRKEQRQNKRASLRDSRRQKREDSRMKRVESRQDRKMRRAEGREDRRDTKSSRELERDAAALEQQEMLDERYGEEEQMDDPIMENTGEDNGSEGYQDDGGYSEDGGSYSEDSGYQEDEGYQEEDGYSEDEGNYDDSYEDEGDNYDFFDDGEGETPFDFADGSGTKINPAVQNVADKIEWNKELCARLKQKANTGQIDKQQAANDIQKCNARIKELYSCLDSWCKFEGEFMSDANGGVQFVNSGPNKKGENKFNRRERVMSAKAAIANAQNQRQRIGRGRRIVNRSVTNVEMGLAPKISNQKIVVPAQSNADGGEPTGIIGLDDSKDFDASSIDIKLGADGKTENKTTKIPFKPILIGIGVGLVVIVALKKFKVL